MKRILKKYKYLIIAAILTVIMGILLAYLFFKKDNNKIMEYKNEYYEFQYDSNWKLEKENNKVILNHSSKSKITIEMILLEDETRYQNLSEISSQIFYDIKKQNPDYQLLAEELLKITKNYYDGYQILFEKDNKEVLITIGKDSEKLFLITYEASSDYFDILLDSEEFIIENFTLLEEVFEISSKLNLSTDSVPWGNNKTLETSMGTMEDEIADYHYIVKANLPANLQSITIDSRQHRYRYIGLEDNQSINVSTSISPKDIYSYLEKDNLGYLYKSYKNDPSSGFKEYLEESKTEKYNRYIYKNTYKIDDDTYENFLLIYEMNRNHTYIIEINAKNIEIPKEWISPIEILSIKNYAGYTITTREDNNQLFDLKIFKGYDYEKKEVLSFKIPIKWQEITAQQLQNNVYQSRSFGIDYFSNLDYYLYRVDYYFDRTYSKNLSEAANNQVEIEKNSMTYKYSYGKYKNITFYKKMMFHGNEFYCYRGEYTESNKVYVDMVLLYAKTDTGLLKIKVLGNGVKIKDSLLEDLINFDTKEE